MNSATIPQPNSAAQSKDVEVLAAIARMCRQCIYDPAEPTSWRAQIEACPCIECPLHPHRPTTKTAAG
jgi:hypothetical protein